MMPSLSPKGLQYGPLDILLLVTAIAVLISGSLYLSESGWHQDTFELYLYIFPLIVGVLFYTIGCSIRNRTPERELKCSTKVISIIILLITVILFLYLLWGKHRFLSAAAIFDPVWPRAFPYPDQIIAMLYRYYEVYFPRPPGYLNLHGYVPEVEWTIDLTIAPFVGIIGWRLGILLPIKKTHIYWLSNFLKRLLRLK